MTSSKVSIEDSTLDFTDYTNGKKSDNFSKILKNLTA